ncbi:hypothetical protein Tco_0805928 [Tanacetum coccineum]
MVDDQLSTRLKDSIKKSFMTYTAGFEKKAKDERKRYIDLVKKSVKDIIKVEVKSQLTQILPKEVSDYATPMIQSSVTESLENIVLANGDDDNENDDNSNEVNKDDDDDDDDDVDSDADGDNEVSNNVKTDSDKDENPNLNQNDDEEEENEEEYVRTPDSFEFNDDDEEYEELYKDVNVRLTDTWHEEQGKEDEEMTDAGYDDSLMQSSSVSSNFANQFLNLDNVPPTDNEVVSMMNVKVRHEEPSTQTPPLLNILITHKNLKFSSRIYLVIHARVLRKGKDEKKGYKDRVEKSVKDIIKVEVKSSLYSDPTKGKYLLRHPVISKLLLLKSLVKSFGQVSSPQTKGLKKQKTSKDVEPSRGSKSKESNSSSSKGTKSQPKSSMKYAQAEELVFDAADTEMPLKQGDDVGNTDDQPNVEETPKVEWFKKPKRPPTLDSYWNTTKTVDFRPPQTWISKIAKAGKPPIFDELMSTPIDFSAYVLNNLKIENLTQEYLVGPAFNLLKVTCKIRVELKYHFKECYKAVTDRLDWTNPEGLGYPFDLSKPLPLIKDQGRQVVPANYFINNDLEYLKGGSLSRKYTTSTTKTKAAKYDTIKDREDMVLSLWSPVKVAYDKYAMWGITHWGPKRQRFYGYASNRKSKHDVFSTKRIIAVAHVKVMNKYDYGYLEEIVVRREDQQLYKLVERDFPRLNLHDIEDMLLLLWVEDLQLGVKSYQKKLNITKPETFRLMHFDELYKFCDGTLSYVQKVLHDIASSLEMDYLPKRRWSKLDRENGSSIS